MSIAAVIVAAGKSSRMGQFKPMLNIGSDSVAQHIIHTFRQAGVREIAVVTGRQAEQLQAHLAGYDITFLHNAAYEATEMFDSAKIGLSYMAPRCSHVLFTPVDIPLFTAQTVRKLIQSGAELACPICGGKQGHPLILSSAVVQTLLTDSGEGGLKGAIARSGISMERVEVDDPGTLRDADTPEEFQLLVDYYNQALYPTDEEIEHLLNELDTPAQVRAHGAVVAAKAAALAVQAGASLNCGLLRAACLLHDMAKTQGKQHPAVAAQFLRDRGYFRLAEVIAQHHDLTEDPPAEAQLLYLADKLVRGTEEVTLETRFSSSRQKCITPEALEQWSRRYRDAQMIAQQYGLDV